MSNSTALVRRSYDPTAVAVIGPFQNKFVEVVRAANPADAPNDDNTSDLVVVRLTAKGNQALFELCHTHDQKEVWCFPSYEFVIHKDSITASQVKTGRPSYVNAILIASRGLPQRTRCTKNSRWVFAEDVRVPGYWGGACAGCKWRDGAASCSYADKNEAKYIPPSMVPAPRLAIEELED
uniref:Uncharacterized protein n=1 Tax=Quercus lobata TaxID=97700 RepID=A0A7N2N7K4_QUELO